MPAWIGRPTSRIWTPFCIGPFGAAMLKLRSGDGACKALPHGATGNCSLNSCVDHRGVSTSIRIVSIQTLHDRGCMIGLYSLLAFQGQSMGG